MPGAVTTTLSAPLYAQEDDDSDGDRSWKQDRFFYISSSLEELIIIQFG